MPQEFAKHEAKLRKAGLLFGDKFEIEFEVGNHYKELKDYRITNTGNHMSNQFTLFVRLKTT